MKLLALPVLLIAPCFVQAQAATPNSTNPSDERITYTLAPMDRILIRAPHAEKINGKTFQIQPDGFVTLPSVGRIQAAGLETSALEKTLAVRLRLKPKKSSESEIVISVVANARSNSNN